MITISVQLNGRNHSVKAASMRLATNKMSVKIDDIINKMREDLAFAERYKEALAEALRALPADPPAVLAAEEAMENRRRRIPPFDRDWEVNFDDINGAMVAEDELAMAAMPDEE